MIFFGPGKLWLVSPSLRLTLRLRLASRSWPDLVAPFPVDVPLTYYATFPVACRPRVDPLETRPLWPQRQARPFIGRPYSAGLALAVTHARRFMIG